ncbi:MAG: DUF2344 domain-containing protein [Phycisphaerales bacterium]|nr:DUF2344 domain-containing protein [Phycisphaerales bacterium]
MTRFETSTNDNSREPAAAPARVRMAVEFSLHGDLRYLSHHDEMRMLTRTVIRSRWPLRFSQGFNPKPRFTLPLPRSVGVASESELAVFELCERGDLASMARELIRQFPAGVEFKRAGWHPRGTPHPARVTYRVDLNTPVPGVEQRIAELLACTTLPVMRRGEPGSAARRIDIRGRIETIRASDSNLRMELTYVDQRTARPTEILELLGLDAGRCASRITREAIEWDTKLFDPEDGVVIAEDVNIEQGKEAKTGS